jgi:CBS domain containing-hemolysin-like protein
MIPIQQAITAAAGARITELPSVIRTSGINRVAVYRGNVRDVIGMVHVFDLMNEELDPQTPVEDLARSAFRISRKYTLQQAFYRLRQHHQSFALVTDEAGRCVGLVTLEDIARHIVGEAPRGVPQSAA